MELLPRASINRDNGALAKRGVMKIKVYAAHSLNDEALGILK